MVRLAGVPNARSGRLEVRRNGLNSTWGTVCSRQVAASRALPGLVAAGVCQPTPHVKC